jgi:hypothetical protein
LLTEVSCASKIYFTIIVKIPTTVLTARHKAPAFSKWQCSKRNSGMVYRRLTNLNAFRADGSVYCRFVGQPLNPRSSRNEMSSKCHHSPSEKRIASAKSSVVQLIEIMIDLRITGILK